ncbi:MAG: hypothetical protein AAB268_12265 [Elusimicrobiota bacterium]
MNGVKLLKKIPFLSSLRRAGLVARHYGRYSIPAPHELAGLCIKA